MCGLYTCDHSHRKLWDTLFVPFTRRVYAQRLTRSRDQLLSRSYATLQFFFILWHGKSSLQRLRRVVMRSWRSEANHNNEWSPKGLFNSSFDPFFACRIPTDFFQKKRENQSHRIRSRRRQTEGRVVGGEGRLHRESRSPGKLVMIAPSANPSIRVDGIQKAPQTEGTHQLSTYRMIFSVLGGLWPPTF